MFDYIVKNEGEREERDLRGRHREQRRFEASRYVGFWMPFSEPSNILHV